MTSKKEEKKMKRRTRVSRRKKKKKKKKRVKSEGTQTGEDKVASDGVPVVVAEAVVDETNALGQVTWVEARRSWAV